MARDSAKEEGALTLKEAGVLCRGMAPVIHDFVVEKIAPLEAEVNALRQHVRDLEARPAVKWAGTWIDGASYVEGSLVQRSGLWLCTRPTASKPGTDPSAWRLLVKQT